MNIELIVDKLNKLVDDEIGIRVKIAAEYNESLSNLQKERIIHIREVINEYTSTSLNYTAPQNSPINKLSEDNLYNASQPPNLELSDDFGSDSQDLIWERIRKSQLNQDQVEPQAETDILENNLGLDEDLKKNTSTVINAPKINALFKVNPTERKRITREIFTRAIENMTKLRKIDESVNADFDNSVQKEADRLLDVYLKTH